MLAGCGCLSGLTIGALRRCRGRCLAAWSWRRLAIAALAFSRRRGPVALSGIHDHFAALRENAGRNVDEVPSKIATLRRTIDGEGLFGFMFAEDGANARATRRPQSGRAPERRKPQRASAIRGTAAALCCCWRWR